MAATNKAKGLLALALLLGACDRARVVEGEPVASDAAARCTSCHGDGARLASADTDPLIAAAPPSGLFGGTERTDRGVGAHQRHLRAGEFWPAVPCGSCHVVPGGIEHARQAQGRVTFSARASTASWPSALVFDPPPAPPSWDGAATGGAPTCTAVYCHGNFPNGAGAVSISWTSGSAPCGSCHGIPPPDPHPPVGTDPAGCADCHPSPFSGGTHLNGQLDLSVQSHGAGWMDAASPGFHAFSADEGLGPCARCHGEALAGGRLVPGCGSCHDRDLPAGVATWRTNCTMCHGGTDDASGAPPRTTWGQSADAVRVGAHRSHVEATHGLAQPLDCTACHVKPADALDAGHVDGPTATVAFGDLPRTGTTPAWSRQDATCSATYCHGATLAGGTSTAPIWTKVDGSQAACGACHGDPPSTGRHSQHVVSFGILCETCHPRAYPSLVDPALHVNGAKDLTATPTRFGGFADWSAVAAGAGTLQGTATACHGGTYYWVGAPPPPRFGCQ